MNGVTDGGSADSDNNDGKDIIARVFAHPFVDTTVEPLQGLGIGVAATWGRETGTPANYKTSGQQTFFSWTNGTSLDDDRFRISPQAYWYWGPFGLFGEYVFTSTNVRRNAGGGRVVASPDAESWQLAASYVLTGENASYRGVTPREGFSPSNGSWGAFESRGSLRPARDRRGSLRQGLRQSEHVGAGSAGRHARRQLVHESLPRVRRELRAHLVRRRRGRTAATATPRTSSAPLPVELLAGPARSFIRCVPSDRHCCCAASSSLFAIGGATARGDTTLLNVSYDPTRELYDEFNAALREALGEDDGRDGRDPAVARRLGQAGARGDRRPRSRRRHAGARVDVDAIVRDAAT